MKATWRKQARYELNGISFGELFELRDELFMRTTATNSHGMHGCVCLNNGAMAYLAGDCHVIPVTGAALGDWK